MSAAPLRWLRLTRLLPGAAAVDAAGCCRLLLKLLLVLVLLL